MRYIHPEMETVEFEDLTVITEGSLDDPNGGVTGGGDGTEDGGTEGTEG